MASGAAELMPFDPYAKQPKMSYKDGYQRCVLHCMAWHATNSHEHLRHQATAWHTHGVP